MPYFKWNNHEIFFRQQGKGPLLLILPDNTSSSICYQEEMDYFSNQYCTVSLDFFGTGKSGRVDVWARNWWKQAAKQAKILVEYLGFKECITLGTGGGGVIALLMAIHYPDKVRAVIADSSVDQVSKKDTLRFILEDRGRRTQQQRQFWEYAHGQDWEQVIEADTAMLLRFSQGGGDHFSNRLAEIHCPVLLTASKQDAVFPKISQKIYRMSEQISNCRVYLNNDGGHPMMKAAPQEFRVISDYFLKQME